MLALLFLYHIWKRFSELALRYDKSKHCGWYGILIYVGGIFIAAFLFGFCVQLFDLNINLDNNPLLSLLEIPIGLLSCYLIYPVLEKKWKSEFEAIETIDDIGKTSPEGDSIQ